MATLNNSPFGSSFSNPLDYLTHSLQSTTTTNTTGTAGSAFPYLTWTDSTGAIQQDQTIPNQQQQYALKCKEELKHNTDPIEDAVQRAIQMIKGDSNAY